MLDILAFVAGRLAAGRLVGRYPQWGTVAILAAVSIPVGVYLIAPLVTALSAREGPEAATAARSRAYARRWPGRSAWIGAHIRRLAGGSPTACSSGRHLSR